MAVPEHSLEFLSKKGVWSGKTIMVPSTELTIGLVKPEIVTEENTNTRYYVSDTEMIERRFLKGATEDFEEKRDTDPFASSVLYGDMTECLISLLGLEERKRELYIQQFLEKKECENMMDELLKDRNVTIRSGMTQYERMTVVHTTFQTPIVIENVKGEIFHTNWPKKDYASKKAEVCWIREVPDGYLGIRKTQSELVESGIWKKVVTKQVTEIAYTIPSIRKKNPEMKAYIEELGIENVPTKAKKSDFIEIIQRTTLFPELFLCV